MRYNQPMARLLYPGYRYLFDSLRRSRFLARRLFGVSCPARSTYFFWDQVTLGLRRVLLGEPLEGLSVCDMGCGPVAVLSVLAARRGCRELTAVDLVPELVESARAVLARSGVEAEAIRSDFDRELGDRTFDLIVYNSAYIPTAWGEARDINRGYAIETVATSVTWSGGADGTDNIRGFLARMPKHLTSAGRILLGFNRFYVDPAHVTAIAEDAGLTVAGQRAWRLLPAVIMEIRR
jgi:methylase of polypeptide subunit release factors